MNNCVFMGRLTKDPEMLGSGDNQVCKFSLAVRRQFRRDNDPEVDYVDCVAFAKQGQIANQYLKKGRQIVIKGRYQTRKWQTTDRSGTAHEFIVESFDFCDGPNGENSGGQTRQSRPAQQQTAMDEQVHSPILPPELQGLNMPF